MKGLLLAITATALSFGLSGCNSSSGPSANPTLGPACTLPSGTQTALVYPTSGSTGVVDNNGEVIIGSTTALPATRQIAIVDSVNPNGIAIPGGLIAVSPPFPSPSQTPTFANPQYQASSFGSAFASGQTVTVYVNDTSTNCSPLQIGSFST